MMDDPIVFAYFLGIVSGIALCSIVRRAFDRYQIQMRRKP